MGYPVMLVSVSFLEKCINFFKKLEFFIKTY